MFCLRRLTPHISWRLPATSRPGPGPRARTAATIHGRPTGRPRGSHIWTEEKLQTSDKFPLSLAMARLLHPSLEPKHKGRRDPLNPALSGVHVRTQIVSPSLCDDAIAYIGATLEKHKGCDILDIHPGAGLWSQTLHAALAPRSHVLLEPRHDKFRDYLDPLLAAPGSTYSLIKKDPCELQTYRDLVADNVFPHQTPVAPHHGRAQEPNNTLLVTGSLMWDPRLPGHGFDSMAKQLFHHFSAAAQSNDLFHAYGLVRTLLWVQHDDFSPVIAGSLHGMQKANRFLEMTHDISLVVRAERHGRRVGKGASGREPQYEIESAIRALRAGRDKGMEIPPHRRDNMYDFAADIEKLSNGRGITSTSDMQDYLIQQEEAGKSTVGLLSNSFIDYCAAIRPFLTDHPDLHIERVPSDMAAMVSTGTRFKPTKRAYTSLNPPAQVVKLRKERARLGHFQRNKANIEALADIHEDIYLLECRVLEMKDGSDGKDAAMKQLDELHEVVQLAQRKIGANFESAPTLEADERIGMRTDPCPRLQWDQRPYEPLVMYSNEAWPAARLSLVSSEPIPRSAAWSPEYFEWIMDFVFGLYVMPSQPLDEALDKMQHGLSDIIKDCPSLKEPKRGGRLNMSQLRVRLLTQEMIEELVTAYKAWPFKAPGSDHNKYFRLNGATQGFSEKAAGRA